MMNFDFNKEKSNGVSDNSDNSNSLSNVLSNVLSSVVRFNLMDCLEDSKINKCGESNGHVNKCSQSVFCPICLDNVDERNVINFGTTCNHKFCKDCVKSYKKDKDTPQTETVSFYPIKRQSTIGKKVSRKKKRHNIKCPICRCNKLIKKFSPEKLIYKTPLQIERYFRENSLGKINDYNIKTYDDNSKTKHKCLNFANMPLQYFNNETLISFDSFIDSYSERFRGMTFATIGQNTFVAIINKCGCISKYSLEMK